MGEVVLLPKIKLSQCLEVIYVVAAKVKVPVYNTV